MEDLNNKRKEGLSRLADMCLYLRSFSDIAYTDRLSKLYYGGDSFTQIFGEDAIDNLYRAPRFEVRFKCLSNLARNYGTNTILELGAGLSTRGLIFSEDPTILYIETDLNIEKKIKLVTEILNEKNRPNLKFENLDVCNNEEFDKIISNLNGPLTVISEGLFIYLNLTQQQQLARKINDILVAKKGLWITPDFATKFDRKKSYGSNSERQVSETSGINITQNSFDSENEIFEFIEKAGFSYQVFDQNVVAGEIVSPLRLNLDKNRVMESLEGRKAYILTPNHY